MVLNHTSDKDKWFIESASSRTNKKRNWYVWSDGKPGPNGTPVPPNNWESLFGGSAWEYMPQTKSFYYHKFYKQQPDLNWRNPEVEKAMFGVMQFWLDRGVAGYRLDAIPTLFEDPQQRNEPATGGTNAQGDPNLDHIYTDNLPEVHDVMRRMRAMVAKYPGDRVLIGETYLPNTAELDKWYGGAKKDELQLPMDMIIGFRTSSTRTCFGRGSQRWRPWCMGRSLCWCSTTMTIFAAGSGTGMVCTMWRSRRSWRRCCLRLGLRL
jgi:alpha-glucosidase